MKKTLLSLLLVPSLSIAQPFAEIGFGAVVGGCMNRFRVEHPYPLECSRNPIGMLALGYEFGNIRVQWEHWSGIVVKDRGMEMVSVRYRWVW